RVLGCYRREWSYGLRFVPEPWSDLNADNDENLNGDVSLVETEVTRPAPDHESLHEALARLPATERCVIEELFLAGRTEGELARLLGSTQRTISRRKQAALRALRDQFMVNRDSKIV